MDSAGSIRRRGQVLYLVAFFHSAQSDDAAAVFEHNRIRSRRPPIKSSATPSKNARIGEAKVMRRIFSF